MALLARLGQPAASGITGAELESQAVARFFQAGTWSCSSLHPPAARGAAVFAPSTSAASPSTAVSVLVVSTEMKS